ALSAGANVEFRRQQHAQRRRCEVDPRAFQIRPEKAEAKVRAGFMLMPESGASRLMYKATKTPAKIPVRRVQRGEFEALRTTVIRRNEMISSATNAIPGPREPGSVAA